MIYAVISDIHANQEALSLVLADAAVQGVEKIICLGDVVGYGPMPAQTVALVREQCDMVLAGNHDDAVSGRIDAADFIDLAGEAVARHRQELSSADIKWLKELPYVGCGEGFIATHGDFTDPEKFYYVDDEEGSRANFEATDAQLMFVGHTHQPKLSLIGASGTVYMTEAQDFTLEKGKRYIVNPGSVGYPREKGGKCLSSYVIYDSQEQTVVFRYLPFSVSTVLQRGGVDKHKPLRLIMWSIVAVLSAALAFWGLSTFFAVREAPSVQIKDNSLIVDLQTLDVSAMTKVSANLKLVRGSCPLQLSIVFKTADGKSAGEERLTVRRSSVRKFSVPKGCKTAIFELRKNSVADNPIIESFKPMGQ